MRYRESSVETDAIDLDEYILEGKTIERAAERVQRPLLWDRCFLAVRVRGRLVFGAHAFKVPPRGTLEFTVIESCRRNTSTLGVTFPHGGRAREVFERYEDRWTEFKTFEQTLARALEPGTRRRIFSMGMTLEDALARSLSMTQFVSPGLDPRRSSTVEFEAPTGLVLVCLQTNEGRPKDNAAMWVDLSSDDDLFVFHCSDANAPEPNFAGLVCSMKITPVVGPTEPGADATRLNPA